ncbi:MAG: hypothetical protein AAGF83_21040 [Cyanobacteria bacterium P01_G01_bin.67]
MQGCKTYEREIQILQAINHPRIPRYLDSLETEDGFCMVQEYTGKSSSQPPERKNSNLAIAVSASAVLMILLSLFGVMREFKPKSALTRMEQSILADASFSVHH